LHGQAKQTSKALTCANKVFSVATSTGVLALVIYWNTCAEAIDYSRCSFHSHSQKIASTNSTSRLPHPWIQLGLEFWNGATGWAVCVSVL